MPHLVGIDRSLLRTYSRGPLPPTLSKIPRPHLQTLSPKGILSPLFSYRANFEPLLTSYNSKQRGGGGTPNTPHTGLPVLHVDRARCLPQGRSFRGRIPKRCLPLAIFSPLLATGANFHPFSDPLKPKAMRLYLVGLIQAFQAYMLTGPVAPHKVEDSDAASPNFLTPYCISVSRHPSFEPHSEPL